jgi:hypothetical protein
MIPGSFAGENSVAISTFHKILGPTANNKEEEGGGELRTFLCLALSSLETLAFSFMVSAQTNKQKKKKRKTNQIYKPEAQERGRRRTRSDWSFRTLSLSPSLLSLTRRL